MYDTVLLPTDGSSGTEQALEHAIGIAEDNDATLLGLYVVDTRLYRAAAKDTQDEVMDSLRTEGEEALEVVAARAEDADVAVETAMIEGVPHKEILDYAGERDADLLAIGRHGHQGPDRIANMGSTTERVVENIDTPALVVNIDE
jgi:nucleotide-binding universal stress UspA family protein